MNRGEKALNLVKKLAKKVGPEAVRLELANLLDKEGKPLLGFSTADQISRGSYKSTPGHEITDAILALMAKRGFSLGDDKAS